MKIIRTTTLLLLISATMPAFAQGQGLEGVIKSAGIS